MYREQVPVTREAIEYVFAHLWQRGQEEFARLGMDDPATAFLGYARQGLSGALLADDVPVLVSGICPEPGGYFTWFQATDEFDRHARHITRMLRAWAKRHPQPLYIYSVLVHPQAGRWFRVMGFERDGWQGRTPVGHPLYRFKRR